MDLKNLNSKNKIVLVIIAIGIALIALFQRGLYSKGPIEAPKAEVVQQRTDIPYVVSTDPSNLKEGAVIPATQVLKINFSEPIENRGEVKYRIEPETELNVELSSDKKTAIMTPKTTFELGRGFTLFINQDTKFDSKKKMDHDEQFHFNTVPYKGV